MKKLFSILISLMMVITIMPVCVFAQDEGAEIIEPDENYYFRMDSIEVTDDNKDDIFRNHPEMETEGKASYNPKTGTLELNNFTAAKNEEYEFEEWNEQERSCAIDADFPLNINLVGSNVLTDFTEAVSVSAKQEGGEPKTPAVINIYGSGELTINGQHDNEWWTSGMDLDCNGTINISCRKLQVNGCDYGYRIDCENLNITADTFVVTAKEDNEGDGLEAAADTTFNGCRKVSIESKQYGLRNPVFRGSNGCQYTVRNCHDFKIYSRGDSIKANGDLLIDYSTLDLHSQLSAIGIGYNGSLTIKNNSEIYAVGGCGDELHGKDEGYGLFFDNDYNPEETDKPNELKVISGSMKLTGAAGAVACNENEITFNSDNTKALGSVERNFFNKEEMNEITFVDSTAKIGDEKAMSMLTEAPASLRDAVIADIPTQSYTGKAITPVVTVGYCDEILKNNVDYKTAYSDNVKLGTGKVTVTGIGRYKDTITKNFKICPRNTKIKSLKKGYRKFTIKVVKQSSKYVSGYQVRYSTSKDMSNARTKYIGKKYYKTKRQIKKLKRKKTYYVQIRTYKKTGNTKYFSDWSNVRSIKTR